MARIVVYTDTAGKYRWRKLEKVEREEITAVSGDSHETQEQAVAEASAQAQADDTVEQTTAEAPPLDPVPPGQVVPELPEDTTEPAPEPPAA